LLVEVVDEAFLQHVVHVVSDGGEMGAGFREALGDELDPGEVKIDSFALDFVMGEGERVGPGPERLFGAQRFDAVVGLGDIGGEREIAGIELQGSAVEFERLVIDLLLGKVEELHGVLAEQIDGGAKVVVVDRLLRVQFDGFGVVLEGLLHRPGMAVEIGEVVVHRGVFGVQGERLFPLLPRALIVLEVAQETAIGHARAGVIGMAREEIIVGLADWVEAVANAPLQVGARHARAAGRRRLVVFDPLVHLGLGRVVVLHQLLVFLLDRVIRVGCGGWRRVGGPGDKIGRRREPAGGHESAEQADQDSSHGFKLAR
jgi:hypothetical protein